MSDKMLTTADFTKAEEIGAISFEFSARVQVILITVLTQLQTAVERVASLEKQLTSKTEALRFEVERNNELAIEIRRLHRINREALQAEANERKAKDGQ